MIIIYQKPRETVVYFLSFNFIKILINIIIKKRNKKIVSYKKLNFYMKKFFIPFFNCYINNYNISRTKRESVVYLSL